MGDTFALFERRGHALEGVHVMDERLRFVARRLVEELMYPFHDATFTVCVSKSQFSR
jgi:hypothetical protein